MKQFTYTCVYLLNAYMYGSRKFRQGDGVRPNIFQGVPNCGGAPIAIFYENLWFSRVGGPYLLLPPPLSLRMTYMHACKAFKSHKKNIANSQLCKGIGGHGHLKVLCRQIIFFITFVLGSTSRYH